MSFGEITVAELKLKLDKGDSLLLLDVREPHELDISKIEESFPIPMGQVESRLDELDPSVETIVMCRSGGRSARIAEILVQNGFKDVKNLVGGINEWAAEIDPDMEMY